MTRDKRAHEAAQRHNLVATGAYNVEHSANQLRAEPAAFECARHFGVQDHECLSVASVACERDAGVGVHFKAMQRGIVAHHGGRVQVCHVIEDKL